MSTQATVTARCVSCKTEREIKAGEVRPGGMPMCHRCFSVMVAVRAKGRAR